MWEYFRPCCSLLLYEVFCFQNTVLTSDRRQLNLFKYCSGHLLSLESDLDFRITLLTKHMLSADDQLLFAPSYARVCACIKPESM